MATITELQEARVALHDLMTENGWRRFRKTGDGLNLPRHRWGI
ncbi:head-tail joining protein [Salmonella enterica subsp. arizonae]|nr:head-tail joining protein [Salmonella enterica subsp. arizonae]